MAPADFVVDLRRMDGIRNPFHDPILRPLSGQDPRVQDYIRTGPGFIEDAWGHLIARAQVTTGTLYLGCYGGRHRSVALAEMIGAYFHLDPVQIVHLHVHLGD